MFGLRTSDINWIVNLLEKRSEIEAAVVFGSRALNTYKPGSDIDLALVGKEVSHSTVNAISFQLNEDSPMPYYFDVLDRNTIQNSNLAEHIETVGITIYKRANCST